MAFTVHTDDSQDPPVVTLSSRHLGSTAFRMPRKEAKFAPALDHALNLAHAYDNEVGRAAQDQTLSAEGKQKHVAPAYAELQAHLDKSLGEVGKATAAREAYTASLGVAPPVDPQILPLDIESRRTYRSLDPQERQKLHAELLAGKNDKLLDALVRAPIGVSPSLAAIKQHRVEQTHGPELAKLAQSGEDDARVATALGAIRNLVTTHRPFTQ